MTALKTRHKHSWMFKLSDEKKKSSVETFLHENIWCQSWGTCEGLALQSAVANRLPNKYFLSKFTTLPYLVFKRTFERSNLTCYFWTEIWFSSIFGYVLLSIAYQREIFGQETFNIRWERFWLSGPLYLKQFFTFIEW
jgi:hypothetical protein